MDTPMKAVAFIITLLIMATIVFLPYHMGQLATDYVDLPPTAAAVMYWLSGFGTILFVVSVGAVALFGVALVIMFFVGIGRQIYIGLGGNPR